MATQGRGVRATRRWLGFLLGVLSIVLPGVSDRISGALAWVLLLLAAPVAGLLAQTALDTATGEDDDPTPGGRLPLRQLVLGGTVLVLVLMCGYLVVSNARRAEAWVTRTLAGCEAPTPVPVVVAPTMQVPVQQAARAWTRGTRAGDGCPRYDVQLAVAPDRDVFTGLADDWDTDPGAAESYLSRIGPTPLLWFPDDHRWLEELRRQDPDQVTGRRLYAADPFVLGVPADVAAELPERAGTAELLTVLGQDVALVRPDPARSLTGRVAAEAIYPAAGQAGAVAEIEDAARRDGVRAGIVGDRTDEAVLDAMCASRGGTAFLLSRQAFAAARRLAENPPDSPSACLGRRDLVEVRPSSTVLGQPVLRIERAAGLLRPTPSSRRFTPSDDSGAAAAALFDWLGGPAQDGFGEQGLTALGDGERRPVPDGTPLGTRQEPRLGQAFAAYQQLQRQRPSRSDVVLAVDTSGSMGDLAAATGRPLLRSAAEAIDAGLRGAAPGRRTGLVLFGGRQASVGVPLQPQAAAAQPIRVVLAAARPAGASPLDAGLAAALGVLRDSRAPRSPAIVVLTDGPGRSSTPQLLDQLRRAGAAEVTVRVIVLGDSCGSVPQPLRGPCTATRDPSAALRQVLADLEKEG